MLWTFGGPTDPFQSKNPYHTPPDSELRRTETLAAYKDVHLFRKVLRTPQSGTFQKPASTITQLYDSKVP